MNAIYQRSLLKHENMQQLNDNLQLTLRSSTSKTRVAFGGMTPG